MRKELKFWTLALLGGLLLYGGGMMVIRLRITQEAYHLDSLKSEERKLKEENMRLRHQLSSRLLPLKSGLQNFSEPALDKLVEIP